MNFSTALMALKEGHKLTRKGWNGKNQFVYLVPANKYDAITEAAKSIADEDGKVSYRAYFALRTAQGDVCTWAPSVSDCLAEDWEVVEEENLKQDHKKDALSFVLIKILDALLDDETEEEDYVEDEHVKYPKEKKKTLDEKEEPRKKASE